MLFVICLQYTYTLVPVSLKLPKVRLFFWPIFSMRPRRTWRNFLTTTYDFFYFFYQKIGFQLRRRRCLLSVLFSSLNNCPKENIKISLCRYLRPLLFPQKFCQRKIHQACLFLSQSGTVYIPLLQDLKGRTFSLFESSTVVHMCFSWSHAS